MNFLRVHPLIKSRYLMAALAGVLLALAFPKLGIAGLAWVAPGLLAVAALDRRGWETFRIGYVGGLAYYLTSLYWLLHIPYRWHGLPLGPAAGWLALSAYCALFCAGWVWFIHRLRQPRRVPLASPEPVQPASAAVAPGEAVPGANPGWALTQSWWGRTAWALLGAAAWVAWEMIISRLFTGFPWNLLGGSQYQIAPLIQIASVVGIYGVSFLLVWVALSLISGALMMLRHPSARWVWMREIILPLGAAMGCFFFGLQRLGEVVPVGRTLRVTMIQPSIPQTLIWDTSRDDERFRQLIELTEQALTNQTDLLLWPEAAVPKLLRYDQAVFDAVTALARKHKVWMIIGADDAEPRLTDPRKRADYYNSSFLINPEGQLSGRYRKRSLVIFGEYIPLQRWVPFLKWFTPIEGGFTRGAGPVQFPLPELKVKASVLICFEDIFAHLVREYPEPDTDLLVNLTNNGWFGEGAAQWQHAGSALFRAVENDLPLVRCSNNGLTCWVDSRGRMRQIFRDVKGTVYGPGFMLAEIPLGHAGDRRSTFYGRHGDWFGWGAVGVTFSLAGWFLVQRFKSGLTR